MHIDTSKCSPKRAFFRPHLKNERIFFYWFIDWLNDLLVNSLIYLFIYTNYLCFCRKNYEKKQRAAKAEWKYGSTFWCSLKATLSTLHPTPKTHLIKCIYSTWAQFMIWNKWSVINHSVHLVFIYLLLIHILSIIKYGEQNYVLNVVTVFT